jgi:hypothetical protein
LLLFFVERIAYNSNLYQFLPPISTLPTFLEVLIKAAAIVDRLEEGQSLLLSSSIDAIEMVENASSEKSKKGDHSIFKSCPTCG